MRAAIVRARAKVSEAVRWLPVDTSIDLSDEDEGRAHKGYLNF
jgi:hypothetical protein